MAYYSSRVRVFIKPATRSKSSWALEENRGLDPAIVNHDVFEAQRANPAEPSQRFQPSHATASGHCCGTSLGLKYRSLPFAFNIIHSRTSDVF